MATMGEYTSKYSTHDRQPQVSPRQRGGGTIDDTGARVKTANGAGYAPPSSRDGDPRFGAFGDDDCDELCNPFDGQGD